MGLTAPKSRRQGQFDVATLQIPVVRFRNWPFRRHKRAAVDTTPPPGCFDPQTGDIAARTADSAMRHASARNDLGICRRRREISQFRHAIRRRAILTPGPLSVPERGNEWEVKGGCMRAQLRRRLEMAERVR